jgi:hypothetical protein
MPFVEMKISKLIHYSNGHVLKWPRYYGSTHIIQYLQTMRMQRLNKRFGHSSMTLKCRVKPTIDISTGVQEIGFLHVHLTT